jgi:hypothetical protein
MSPALCGLTGFSVLHRRWTFDVYLLGVFCVRVCTFSLLLSSSPRKMRRTEERSGGRTTRNDRGGFSLTRRSPVGQDLDTTTPIPQHKIDYDKSMSERINGPCRQTGWISLFLIDRCWTSGWCGRGCGSLVRPLAGRRNRLGRNSARSSLGTTYRSQPLPHLTLILIPIQSIYSGA